MLKLLRNKKLQKRVFYVLAAVIVPAFIFWGSAAVTSPRGNRGYAGKLFGKKVSYTEYSNALYAWRNQLIMQYGDKAQQLEQMLDQNQAVWDRLLLEHETRRRRIRVSDSEVSNYIGSLVFLQKDGVFDPQLYMLFLKYSIGTQPRVFEEQIRQLLKFQKLFEQATEDVHVSDSDVRSAYEQRHKKIKIRYLEVSIQDRMREATVSDQEIQTYYDNDKKRFTIPIQIDLRYLGFEYPKDANDEQKTQAKDKALELKKFLTAAPDLTKAAQHFELQAHDTGFFSLGDPVPGLDWVPTSAEQLFNLKDGETSDPVETTGGVYIFALKEKQIDFLQDINQVRDTIQKELARKKAYEAAKAEMDSINKTIAATKGATPDTNLSQIAQQHKAHLSATDFFGRFEQLPSLGPSLPFFDAAFKLKPDQISETIETPQGFYLVECIDEQPIDEEQFKKEKEMFKENLLAAKQEEAFEEFFKKLKERAKLQDYVGPQTPAQDLK